MKKFFYLYLSIFAISCSVLIFEITLLRFFALKLLGAWPFLIVSMAFLGIGASGTYLYLRRDADQPDINFSLLSKFSRAYTISIPFSIILFALLPLYPGQPGHSLSPGNVSYNVILSSVLYMVLFAIPFFLSGVCISYVLSLKEVQTGRVLFFDLMGAGLGAVLAILFLGQIGGYGVMALSLSLAFAASLFFLKEAHPENSFNKLKVFAPHFFLFALLLSSLLIYPWAMIKISQFDIVAPKSLQGDFKLFKEDFKGLGATYWNPIARIDLSKEGESDNEGFLFGLSPKYRNKKYTGRYILVDGGATTRQFKLGETEKDNEFLGHFLFSIPYQLKNNIDEVLIIGAGGGVEISVAKYFKTKQIDVAEINSATVDILKGKNKQDPLSDIYSGFTSSNKETAVKIYNEEGRSFLSKSKAQKYDILQLTGVDLLTALKSGGLVLSENYLYTREALEYYYDALKEGGYAQITYWSEHYALRLFNTALTMLEDKGQGEPSLSLVAVTDNKNLTNLIIKKGVFSDAEIQKIKKIAEDDGFEVLFDSEVKKELLEKVKQVQQGIIRDIDIGYNPNKKGAYFLASLKEGEFPEGKAALKNLPFDLTPTYDNKPFFYSIYKKPADLGDDPTKIYAAAGQNKISQRLILIGTILAFSLILLPIYFRRFLSGQLKKIPLSPEFIFFFGVVGIAFSLIEVVLIQKFSIFVGGPFYSMGVTLPTILIFYSLGAFSTSRIKLSYFWILAMSVAGIVLYGLLGYLFFDNIIKSLFYLSHFWRILIAVILISPLGFFLGFPTPIVLEAIKVKINKAIVPVMWGVNSCGNVIGALLFASISQITGFNLLLLFSSFLYLIALSSLVFKMSILTRI